MTQQLKFSAVILAGGESRRMGCDKAWLEVRGETLLSRAVVTVRRAGAAEVFISGRHGVDYAGLECPVLFDLKPGGGPLGGVERALAAASNPLLLVCAVDMSKMTATLLRKMISCCDEQTGVVPKCRGKLEPLAAIYPKRSHALVVAALRQSRLTAREFAEACLRKGMVRKFSVPPAEQGRFANCNTPDDLPASHSVSRQK